MQVLWFWLVFAMFALYVVLDGYDFGVGILHRYVAKRDDERRTVLSAIGPFWDGNEVWLIAGGGALFVAFPKVLSAAFSGFYLAMFLVLWALLIRALSIEFRSHLKNKRWRGFWDYCFVGSSALLPILLGTALGNVLRGVPLNVQGEFSLPLVSSFYPTGALGVLDYYTVSVGVFAGVVVTGHGALFLVWKTEGDVQARARRLVTPLWSTIVILGLGLTVSSRVVCSEWFSLVPTSLLVWFGLLLYVGGIAGVFTFHYRKRALAAFVASSAFVVGLLVAVAAAAFPVLLRSTFDARFTLTVYNASVSTSGLVTGARWWFLGFPLAAGYVALLHYLHRGKARPVESEEGY
jgi:cytochrome d ubiquinol oxidase subunit II